MIEVHDKHAEVDVRGKVARSASRPASHHRVAGAATVRVNVDLQPRGRTLNELNLIGSTVDEATDRLDKFFDQATVADVREFRIVHGHGTGRFAGP